MKWSTDLDYEVPGKLVKKMQALEECMGAESRYKQVELLSLGASSTRIMQGALHATRKGSEAPCLSPDYTLPGANWISCKSAKDRTSLLCTLQAVEELREVPGALR